mgnify:CR=1 FL=1
MPKLPPIPASELIPIYLPWWVIRASPYTIPSAAWNDAPLCTVSVNVEWASHIRGLLEVMQWPDAWAGSDAEKQAAVDAAIAIEDAFCMSEPCCATTAQGVAGVIAQMIEDRWDGTIGSVAPDAPDNTYGNDSGDDTEDKVKARRAALCMAVNRWIRTCFEIEASAIRRSGAIVGVVVGGIIGLVNPIAGLVAAGVFTGSVEALAAAFESEPSIRRVVCCMYQHLMNLEITEANFRTSPGDRKSVV